MTNTVPSSKLVTQTVPSEATSTPTGEVPAVIVEVTTPSAITKTVPSDRFAT